MKKKIIRMMGVGLASLTVMSSAMPVLAAPPAEGDSNSITVQGVAKTDTSAVVTIYRVVEPVYGKNGLVNYKTVGGVEIADIEKPTSSEVAKAVSAILANPENFPTSYQLERNSDGEFVKDSVAPGEYIAIVSGTNTTVYNPAVVSVNYTDANDGTSTTVGSVNLGTVFAYGDVAYMKSSTPSIDKNIVVDGVLVKGDTVDAGGSNTTAADEITFQIDSQLPSYQMSEVDGAKAVYRNPVYKISDKLDTTFANITEIHVMNASDVDLVPEQDYTIEGGVGQTSFTVQFTEEYLLNHGNEKVKITYKTALNDTGDNNNYAENLNVAKLEYSNDPTDVDSIKTFKAKTYHYTFAIDGIIDGQTVTDGGTYNTTSGLVESHEVNKVGQATRDITTEWQEKVKTGDITTYSSNYALAGAEFTLYSDAELTNAIAVSTSDDYGHIPYTGLDEGTYYMKETKAPAGWTLNDNIYKIDIAATLDEEGVLESYTVTTAVSTDEGENYSAAGSISYNNTKSVNTTVDDAAYGRVVNTIVTENDVPVEIVDTKLSELPSTGSIGTTIFSVVGITMFCGFAGLGLAARRKKED